MAVFSNIWLNIWYPEFFCFYRRFDFSLMFQCCFYFFQKSLTLFCTLSPFCYVSIMTVIGTHSLAMFIVLHCSISLRYFICIKDAYKEQIILGLWRSNIFRNMNIKSCFSFNVHVISTFSVVFAIEFFFLVIKSLVNCMTFQPSGWYWIVWYWYFWVIHLV